MITLKRATKDAIKYACMRFHYAKAIPSAFYAYNVYSEGGGYGADASYSGTAQAQTSGYRLE